MIVLYLTKNPQKIQQFIDYTHVHWNKLLIEADTNGVAKELNEERRKEIVANFEAVKDQFFSNLAVVRRRARISVNPNCNSLGRRSRCRRKLVKLRPNRAPLLSNLHDADVLFAHHRVGDFSTDKGT